MKIILCLSILLLSSQLYGQNISVKSKLFREYPNKELTSNHFQVNRTFVPELKGNVLVSVRTANPYLQRTFLIDKNGETVSSEFMPSVYFRPNDNVVVVTGRAMDKNDSFNPYGAKDLSSMLFYTTVNSFISKIRIGKR